MTIRIVTNMNFHGRDSARSLLMGQSTYTLFYLIIVVPTLINITFQGQICNGTTTRCGGGNYTAGSTFDKNLNILFDRLAQGANNSGFNISVYGSEGPDRIYGLLQCREDMTADQCYSCWQFATTNIREDCGTAVSGSIWPFQCFLRYANYNFIGKLDTDLGSNYAETFSGNTVVSMPLDFESTAANLLKQLSIEAATETKRSALSTALDSASQMVYGLVQCTRDLSPQDCRRCLSYSVNKMFTSDTVAAAGVQYWSQSCILRYELYPFFNSTQGAVNNAQIKCSHKSRCTIHIILGVVGGLVLGLIVCVFATRKRLKSALYGRGYQGHNKENRTISHGRQMVFTMEILLTATNNFHNDKKLGEGGFGPVYKGTTQDGKEIAVKKLSIRSMQGRKEFMNEVEILAKVQHRNLVNLLGCCVEGSERLLIYEYLPNRSLDKILFETDINKRSRLDWQKRYNIIVGVARGLLYLHQDSQLRIIHRDIKTSNVLLDEKLNPKIADFGLARLFSEDESHVSTKVAGTCGYMPPEYAMQGQLSMKTDVYSFGVLLLELIAGRKNTDYNLLPEMQILLGWVWNSYHGGNIMRIIDPAIIETCDEKLALRCIQIGLLCTQAEPQLRPLMDTISLMLSPDSVTYLPDPTKPAFVSQTTNSRLSSSHTRVSPVSNNTASISDLVPR